MTFSEFNINFQNHTLVCDWCGDVGPNLLVILHGAGNGTRDRFSLLRQNLIQHQILSLALDFIGHGKTGGELGASSLALRTEQAATMIDAAHVASPLHVLGSSMGAYNAIKLTQRYPVDVLVLFVPGIYTPECYETPFGPSFSKIIRKSQSWEASDAWEILAAFKGRLLIVAAGEDQTIPYEIPERLYNAAVSAKSKELYWVTQSPHLLVPFLNENVQEMSKVIQKIQMLFR